ncbi:MAG: hypothetical protein CFE41_16540 [Burkholderiales bacterium PBB2]|nr:MAG: hypothetical protein CFE41_16540 [Burkholderiales bacterium PBB2]
MQRLADSLLWLAFTLVPALALWSYFYADPRVEHPAEAVHEAAGILQSNALAASSVDWPAAQARAKAIAERTGRRAGLDEAIASLIGELNDAHSHYIPPASAEALNRQPEARSSASSIADLSIDQNHIPTLHVHAFGSLNPQVEAHAAMQLSDAVQRSRARFDCGMVVDLSDNGGGNMWPMLNGLYSILPAKPLGYFVSKSGERTPISSSWPYSHTMPEKHHVRALAIVVNRQTASSGEFVAASLLAHPNSKLFGEPTAGLTTGNQLYPLQTGGLLAVATSKLATADGRPVNGALVPTMLAEPANAVATASAWVRQECQATE